MRLVLHLVDGSFSPVHSRQTAIEPIAREPAVHIVRLPVGRGNQTIKWLTLAAQSRLQALHKHHGRVRQREPVLGSEASFIPCGVAKNRQNVLLEGASDDADSGALDPYLQVNQVFEDNDHVFIVFNQEMGASISSWGSSAFFRGRFHEMEVEPEPEKDAGEAKAPPPKPRDPSMFFERMFEADSQSCYETRAIMDRAFEADWKFHVKKPRFMQRQPRTVRERMRSYYPMLKAIYSYYAASGGEGSPFTLNMAEMRTLMQKCDLPVDHIEILWAETNFEKERDAENADRELQRFEFVEIFIRLAWEHYVSAEAKDKIQRDRSSPGKSSQAAVQALDGGLVELVEHHVLPQAWRGVPHARFFADPDAFRRERLYNEDVNKVLLEFCDDIYSLFVAYARLTQGREGRVVGGEHSPSLVGYREFVDMCRTSNLVVPGASGGGGGSGTKTKKGKAGGRGGASAGGADGAAGGDSLRNVRTAFALCQMTVVDELRRSKRRSNVDTHQHATFVEFTEAIVRLADMSADPKGNDPKYQLTAALREFLTRIVAAHDKAGFWQREGNTRRLWRDYKKKFGLSRNAVKRRGFGPEVGVRETANSSKQVLARRQLTHNKELTVFAVPSTTLNVLSRKYGGGVATRLAAEAEAAAQREAAETAAAEAAAAGDKSKKK